MRYSNLIQAADQASAKVGEAISNDSTGLISYLDTAKSWAIEYGPGIIKAIAVLVIGFWVIGKIVKLLSQILQKSDIDVSLANFLASIGSILMKLMLILAVASMLGIETTSFIAVFGALMVGIGMAFNGSIGHLVSGVMIMLFKPFKLGDLVTIAGGQTGTVTGINAFNTTLKTLDNRKIIISNSNVTNNDIINISGQEITGVELTFGIGYDDNIDEARKVILEVGQSCPHILDDPAQGVVVAELGDSSVNLATRPFCKSEHYWETKFYMTEHVKKAFDEKGIGIPFPTMELNLNQPVKVS